MNGTGPGAEPATVGLSLISHTNAGKTTLARTLLGRDVGEVRDAPHVTQDASAHTMIETPAGDRLRLWDTPGFGDSARLARRLAQQGNPIGWFLTQVWDRFRDRPLWLAQQAVRNVRDQADVVLYLVNASESPSDAGWLEPEMQVLAWIGKPVVVLLNQTGPPRPREEEASEESRWRDALSRHAFVRGVLTLDAFARCWAQEIVLLQAVGAHVADAKRAAFERLARAWHARRLSQFEASIDAIAQPVARAAVDREVLPEAGMKSALRGIGRALGLARDDEDGPQARAMAALAQRLDAGMRAATDGLIAIHGLEGRAAGDVIERLSKSVTKDAPVHEGKAAMLGGVVSGALSGLAVDLAHGGLTLGAGMLAGGVIGALGAAGLARGYNVARGAGETTVRWSDAFLDGLVQAAIIRYLAVAHYGRGRGEWTETENPAFWRDTVARAVEGQRGALAAAWVARGSGDEAAVLAPLRDAMRAAAMATLRELYPATLDVAEPLSA